MSMDGVRALNTESMRLSSLGFEEDHCSGDEESTVDDREIGPGDDREMGPEGMSLELRSVSRKIIWSFGKINAT